MKDNPRKSSRAGYTVLELVISATIVGILTSIALPALIDFLAKAILRHDGHQISMVLVGSEKFVETDGKIDCQLGQNASGSRFMCSPTESNAYYAKLNLWSTAYHVSGCRKGKKQPWKVSRVNVPFTEVEDDTPIYQYQNSPQGEVFKARDNTICIGLPWSNRLRFIAIRNGNPVPIESWSYPK